VSTAAVQSGNLRRQVVRGLGWKLFSQITLQITQIAVAVMLARLLRPHDYGLAGMVLAVSTLVLVFSDLALGAALVQRRELTEEDRSTVFWTGAAAGILFTAAGVAASGPVARFYGQPAVQPLLAAFSFSFLLTSLGTAQKALLTRDMNFRSLELRQVAGALSGGAVGVSLAAFGAGAWAIIAQQLTLGAVSTVLLWVASSWRPRLVYSFASLRELGGFSGNVFGQRLLYQLTRGADNVLIGRFLGPAAVGAYAVSYNVMLVPLSRLAMPVSEVLFPAMSRMQDDRSRVAHVWLRVNRVVATVSIPAMLGLIVVADEFVRVVLGNRWHSAVPVVRILAWVGALQAVQTLNEDVLQALNRTGTMLRFMMLWSVSSVGSVLVGLHWGIVGVASAFAISGTLLAPVSIWLTARVAGTSLREYAANLSPVIQSSLATVAVVFVARLLLVAAAVPTAPRLVILIAIGIAVHIPLAAWRMPDVVADLRRLRPATSAG
jgi:O-antigen/teichoic acid export membrane protein